MKTVLFILAAAALFSLPVWAEDTYVDGYVRSDGTYVPPHFRSKADRHFENNYSSRGNTNPYTESVGAEQSSDMNSERTTRSSRKWSNTRPYGSSYRKP